MKHSLAITLVACLAFAASPAYATSSICQEQTIDGGIEVIITSAAGSPKGGRANCVMSVGGCIPLSLSEPVSDTGLGYTTDLPDITQYREGELNPLKTIIATIENRQYTPVYDFDDWQTGNC